MKWALNIIRKILVTLKSSMPLLGPWRSLARPVFIVAFRIYVWVQTVPRCANSFSFPVACTGPAGTVKASQYA